MYRYSIDHMHEPLEYWQFLNLREAICQLISEMLFILLGIDMPVVYALWHEKGVICMTVVHHIF